MFYVFAVRAGRGPRPNSKNKKPRTRPNSKNNGIRKAQTIKRPDKKINTLTDWSFQAQPQLISVEGSYDIGIRFKS